MDFDVLPGELLADEAEAGGPGQVENLGALGRLGLLLQKGVDAEGADGRVGQRRGGDGGWVEAGLRPDGGVEPVDDAGGLAAPRHFAGQVVERPGVGPQGEEQGQGSEDDQGAAEAGGDHVEGIIARGPGIRD